MKVGHVAEAKSLPFQKSSLLSNWGIDLTEPVSDIKSDMLSTSHLLVDLVEPPLTFSFVFFFLLDFFGTSGNIPVLLLGHGEKMCCWSDTSFDLLDDDVPLFDDRRLVLSDDLSFVGEPFSDAAFLVDFGSLGKSLDRPPHSDMHPTEEESSSPPPWPDSNPPPDLNSFIFFKYTTTH